MRTGGCQCGSVRYEVRGEPLAVTACHCTDCQRQSGSAFSMSLIVRRDDFRVTGETRSFASQADSGAGKEGAFCPTCGVRIYNTLERMPDTVNVKPGTLDETKWLEPSVHVWLSSRQPWVLLPEDTTRFDRNPVRG